MLKMQTSLRSKKISAAIFGLLGLGMFAVNISWFMSSDWKIVFRDYAVLGLCILQLICANFMYNRYKKSDYLVAIISLIMLPLVFFLFATSIFTANESCLGIVGDGVSCVTERDNQIMETFTVFPAIFLGYCMTLIASLIPVKK